MKHGQHNFATASRLPAQCGAVLPPIQCMPTPDFVERSVRGIHDSKLKLQPRLKAFIVRACRTQASRESGTSSVHCLSAACETTVSLADRLRVPGSLRAAVGCPCSVPKWMWLERRLRISSSIASDASALPSMITKSQPQYQWRASHNRKTRYKWCDSVLLFTIEMRTPHALRLKLGVILRTIRWEGQHIA